MPSPDLICEVRTERGTYRDWLTVSVGQNFDSKWQRTFRLTCAEPSDKLQQALAPGTRVDIALAGQPVITQGFIAQRQAAFDANRHGVAIAGVSKADLATRASAEGGTGQYRGYTLEQIANGELKRFGLKFRLENAPPGAQEVFANVIRRYGETPFDLIQRLCRQRGVWFHADADGNFVGGAQQQSTAGAGNVFQDGVNILSANCEMNWLGANEVALSSQQPGSDNLFGRKASEISAKSTISGDGVPGLTRRVLAEMPLAEKELKLRTNMEVQAILAALMRVTVTYQGWLNPSGQLWALTDFVTVRSPMLFPFQGGEMNLQLWGYQYTQTPEGQTVTSIELVNRAAFQQRVVDASAGPTFSPGSTDAQTESFS